VKDYALICLDSILNPLEKKSNDWPISQKAKKTLIDITFQTKMNHLQEIAFKTKNKDDQKSHVLIFNRQYASLKC